MALTFKTNGSLAANIISAQWFNDYYNLLTGSMLDQAVQITNSLTLQVPYSDPSTALTTALATGTSLGIGVYQYVYTWVNADGGETKPSPTASITTTSGNQNVSLTVIATGPGATSKRRIYRTKVGGGTFYLLTTIADNTTTTYTDSTADGSLGTALSPNRSTFGASLIFNDLNGVLRASISQDPGNSGTLVLLAGGLFEFYASGNAANPTATLSPTEFTMNGGIYLGSSTSSYIRGNPGYIGFKAANGTKLAEARGDGNFIISGNQYQTSQASASIVGSKTFDGFDVAEIYETDQDYSSGTVVCPGANHKMVKCTHDNCFAASIVSSQPGLLLGEELPGQRAVAIMGRVRVKCAYDIGPRTLVVSDGRGGIRPARKGEVSFVMGFTINETTDGQVGIILRPYVLQLQ